MRFRLLAPLPALMVSLRSVHYILEASHEPGSRMFSLYAVPTVKAAGDWLIGSAFDSAMKRDAALFKTGFDVEPASIGESAMRWLVAEKRAEVIAPA